MKSNNPHINTSEPGAHTGNNARGATIPADNKTNSENQLKSPKLSSQSAIQSLSASRPSQLTPMGMYSPYVLTVHIPIIRSNLDNFGLRSLIYQTFMANNIGNTIYVKFKRGYKNSRQALIFIHPFVCDDCVFFMSDLDYNGHTRVYFDDRKFWFVYKIIVPPPPADMSSGYDPFRCAYYPGEFPVNIDSCDNEESNHADCNSSYKDDNWNKNSSYDKPQVSKTEHSSAKYLFQQQVKSNTINSTIPILWSRNNERNNESEKVLDLDDNASWPSLAMTKTTSSATSVCSTDDDFSSFMTDNEYLIDSLQSEEPSFEETIFLREQKESSDDWDLIMEASTAFLRNDSS